MYTEVCLKSSLLAVRPVADCRAASLVYIYIYIYIYDSICTYEPRKLHIQVMVSALSKECQSTFERLKRA